MMAAVQRIGVQLPRARRVEPSKSSDLAREAVSCNHSSRRAVTSHQMTGHHPIRSRVRRWPVITNAGLDGTGSHTTTLRVCITGKCLLYNCCNLLSKQLIALGREVQPILA